MTFNVNRHGIITNASSGREIIGSKVKEDFTFLDFVVIKRDNNDRSVKWGLFGGKLDDSHAIVRTTSRDEFVPMSILTPVEPSDTLIQNLCDRINALIGNSTYNYIVKFFLNFLTIFYEDKIDNFDIPVCEECGALFPSRTVDGHRYCESCYSNRFVTCVRCGSVVDAHDAVDGECIRCHQRHYILPYHREQPRLRFYGDNHNNTVPFLGVELEVAYGGHRDANVAEILPIINTNESIFMYCMHDSSLDDGFENITQPATLEYHTYIKDKYKSVFKKLRELGYLSHDTSCCGLHVHVNRDFFENNEISALKKILKMNHKFWNEFLKFSRRVKNRMNYCMPTDEYSDDEYIEYSNRSESGEWHHFVISYASETTIEFRIFRGTLNIETFLATLELVHNIVCTAKYKTDEEIDNMTFEDLITGETMQSYWDRINNVDREQ